MSQQQRLLFLLLLLLPIGAITTTYAQSTTNTPTITYTLGSPNTFATHAQLESYGFAWGPSDGQFGAIPMGGGNYRFYGTASSNSGCSGTPNVSGAFTFTGTLDQVTGSNGCKRLFGPGSGPSGWVFDRDYAGGGHIVPIQADGKSGLLMPFHAEFHWKNTANPPSYECHVGASASQVPCYYGGIGLAVSTDGGNTFNVVGQIYQPSEPLSAFQGGGNNMDSGYGSLIVADANGNHIDNPPSNPNDAYFYLFFSDRSPGLPGSCATYSCLGIARAPYLSVISAVFSGNPQNVATVFQKFDGSSPNPWTQPATSNTPDLSGTSGKYAPLWTDEAASDVSVIYDSSFNVYLAAYSTNAGIKLRASSDLIHWSEPLGTPYAQTGRSLYYPTLMGETGDPTVAGPAPRIYFSSFPTGLFPNYATSVFQSVQLTLSSTTTTTTSPSGSSAAVFIGTSKTEKPWQFRPDFFWSLTR